MAVQGGMGRKDLVHEKREVSKEMNETDNVMDDFVLESTDTGKGKNFQLPNLAYKKLFPYQKEGLEWLWSLYCKGSGGIVALDMGMGKTWMVGAFLFGLIRSGFIKKAIIMAPSSVAPQWSGEVENVGLIGCKEFLTGNKDVLPLKSIAEDGGVLITSFDVFREDHLHILEISGNCWDYVVIDEAHRIKNDKTQIFETLKEIDCAHKIVMTGTPIQNNLEEFYVLMKYCCPDVLGNYPQFKKDFIVPTNAAKYKGASAELIAHSINASEKHVYTALINGENVLRYEDEKGTPLVASTIARDICNHPLLVVQTEGKKGTLADKIRKRLCSIPGIGDVTLEDARLSCKVDFTLHLVDRLLAEGHKILIFYQGPKMLDIMEEFQQGDTKSIFVMTTHVGGVGINLTSASRVIILDPAKNPSNDEQSVDRAYRLKQVKDVLVYRLVTVGTIEEHTYRQQILKGEMSISVLQGEQCRREVKKKLGRVLSIPPLGFGVAITHRELEALYPNGFDQAVDSDINDIASHRVVLGLTNHALLFSKKEIVPVINKEYKKCNANVPVPTRLDDYMSTVKEQLDGANATMNQIRMPKKYVSYFVGEDGQNIKELKKISGGARIDLCSTEALASFQLCKITGTGTQVDRASRLVNSFIEMVGWVIGKGGSIIKDIKMRSGADVELGDPTRGTTMRKFVLRGTVDQIQRARSLIYEAAELDYDDGSSTVAPVLTGQDLLDRKFLEGSSSRYTNKPKDDSQD
uniref:Helicase ATP-binding domain-containing protein n=1 Tax=Oryza meridionalis TaxID=40149 RepID=A0A0E0E9T3_9ORYZ